jgi:hypothetical protein
VETREGEQGCPGDRRHDRRGLPRVRAEGMAEDHQGDCGRNLSTRAGSPVVDRQARRDQAPVGDTDGAGSGDPAGRRTSAGTAFRSGFQRTQPWLPPRTLRRESGGRDGSRLDGRPPPRRGMRPQIVVDDGPRRHPAGCLPAVCLAPLGSTRSTTTAS